MVKLRHLIDNLAKNVMEIRSLNTKILKIYNFFFAAHGSVLLQLMSLTYNLWCGKKYQLISCASEKGERLSAFTRSDDRFAMSVASRTCLATSNQGEMQRKKAH